MKKPFFLLALIFFFCNVQAQEVTTNTDASTDTSHLLNKIILRSFGYNTQPAKVPAAVSYLSTQDLNKFNGNDFVAAVNTVPGVKMDERSPGSYRLSIRGNLLRSAFGVRNVKVYWNGIPFTDANGNTYLNQVAMHNIGSMEILKGPSGSQYGAGTGGVVLLNSERMNEYGKQLQAHVAYGSYGTFTTGAKFIHATENAQHVIGYTHQQSDGYRDHSQLMRRVADYTGTYTIDARQQLHAHVFYSNLYYQTPGGLTQAEMNSRPQNARPGAKEQQAALYLKTLYAGVGHEFRIHPNLTSTTGIYISHTNFKNPTIRNFERKTEQGAGGRFTLAYEKQHWKIIAGGEFQHSFTNAGVYANNAGVRDTLQSQDEISSTLYNIFLQTDYSIGKWLISGGMSYNSSSYGFTRANEPGFQQLFRTFNPDIIPRLAVRRSFGKYVNMYASVSRGFSPPSIDEVYASDAVFNRSLNAENGMNYEVGVKVAPIRNKFWGELSVYYFKLDETIVSRRDSTGGDYYVNAGTTDQWGVESALHYIVLNQPEKWFSFLKVWANITVTNARFVDYEKVNGEFDGNRLTGVPYEVIQYGVDVKTRWGAAVMLSHAYTGRLPLNDANTFFASHYNRCFARAEYDLPVIKKMKTSLYVAWEKSFNNPFGLGNDLNAAVNRYFNPSAPWQITGGVVLKLSYK